MVCITTGGGRSGDFAGVPPADTQWISKGFIYNRLENGKVLETDWVMDTLGHLKQLGATMTPAIELPVPDRDRTEASHA